MRKQLAIALAATMMAGSLAACGGSSAPATTAAAKATTAAAAETTAAATTAAAAETTAAATTAAAASGDATVIQVGFENTEEEPVGQGVKKWAELVEKESNGSIKFELFPNSSLGSKSELIDQMTMGENIITIADGAFYAEYGVPDMGIMYGPFFFQSWDDVWKLTTSDWYKDQCQKLADKGLTILASNWIYGERELMTKSKVVTPEDMAGMKIRLANSKIYVEGFNALGATAVPMALSDVYTALQNGTLDGVENPLSTLYGQKFQEVTKYVLMTGHIKNFTTWCIGTDFFNTLTDEQKEILVKTGEEAGLYNNDKQQAAVSDYRKKLEDAGVEFTELTDEQIKAWADKGKSFYDMGKDFGWSDGLYETTQKAMGR